MPQLALEGVHRRRPHALPPSTAFDAVIPPEKKPVRKFNVDYPKSNVLVLLGTTLP